MRKYQLIIFLLAGLCLSLAEGPTFASFDTLATENTNLADLSPKELWELGSEFLETGGDRGVDVCNTMLGVGYGIFGAEKTDQALALDLAERSPITDCDVKDAVIADLKYGPSGSEPNEERYRFLIVKAASYIFYTGGPGVFAQTEPTGSIPRSLDVLQARLGERAPHGGESDLRRLVDLFLEVLEARDQAIEVIDSPNACGKLHRALRHLEGTPGTYVDKEFGEMLLWAARYRPPPPGPRPDVDYALGRHAPSFSIYGLLARCGSTSTLVQPIMDIQRQQCSLRKPANLKENTRRHRSIWM